MHRELCEAIPRDDIEFVEKAAERYSRIVTAKFNDLPCLWHFAGHVCTMPCDLQLFPFRQSGFNLERLFPFTCGRRISLYFTASWA